MGCARQSISWRARFSSRHLEAAGIARRVARLWPLLTVKG